MSPNAQDFLEGASELGTPAVDQGVEGRVGVPYPVQDLKEPHDGGAFRLHHGHVEDEERQPAERKNTHDDPQCLQSFVVFKAEPGLAVPCLRTLLATTVLCPNVTLRAVDVP